MTATAYADIRRRLAEATGPDRELDGEIWCLCFAPDVVAIDFGTRFPPYTASLDAALALVEEKLPGWWGSVDFGDWGDNPVRARLNLKENHAKANGEGATPALAVLSALFAALEPAHD